MTDLSAVEIQLAEDKRRAVKLLVEKGAITADQMRNELGWSLGRLRGVLGSLIDDGG